MNSWWLWAIYWQMVIYIYIYIYIYKQWNIICVEAARRMQLAQLPKENNGGTVSEDMEKKWLGRGNQKKEQTFC